uniref:Uncharacterized protein n=1 Tax=Triticum urartu TaxID=4572 RepID=A0A8R7UW64_TRIUA
MPASAHRDLLSSALLASHYLLPLRQRLPSPARCWQTTGSRLLRRPSTLPAPLPNHRSLSTRLLRAPSSPRPPPIVPSPSLNAYAAPQVPTPPCLVSSSSLFTSLVCAHKFFAKMSMCTSTGVSTF